MDVYGTFNVSINVNSDNDNSLKINVNNIVTVDIIIMNLNTDMHCEGIQPLARNNLSPLHMIPLDQGKLTQRVKGADKAGRQSAPTKHAENALGQKHAVKLALKMCQSKRAPTKARGIDCYCYFV